MPRSPRDGAAFQAAPVLSPRATPRLGAALARRTPPARAAAAGRRARPACLHTGTSQPASAAPAFDASKSALQQGIKAVAVGKHGSRAVPREVLHAIHEELALCAQPAPPRELLWLRASFLGSLFVKSELTEDEMQLLVRWCGHASSVAGRQRAVASLRVSAGEVLTVVCTQPCELGVFAMRVLCDERLDESDAARLGSLLYAADGDWQLKALIAHVMRVRHEDENELAGLSVAARRSVNARFRSATRSQHAYALMAEPYDGTEAYELLTPLIARYVHEQFGVRVVLGVGESSGPKYGPNLRDVAMQLGVRFVRDAQQLRQAFDEGEAMVAVDQRDVSDGLYAWVRMRRVIVKRPAIASAEKFADGVPHGCDLFFGSVFHDSYLLKMAAAAEANGYEGYVIMSRGVEGTLGVSVSATRRAVILSGCRTEAGYSRRTSYVDGVEGYGRRTRGSLTANDAVTRLSAFERDGQSGDALFDRRAAATLSAVDEALRALRADGCAPLQRAQ